MENVRLQFEELEVNLSPGGDEIDEGNGNETGGSGGSGGSGAGGDGDGK